VGQLLGPELAFGSVELVLFLEQLLEALLEVLQEVLVVAMQDKLRLIITTDVIPDELWLRN